MAEKARVGATSAQMSSSSAQINLPVYSGITFSSHDAVKEEVGLEEPSKLNGEREGQGEGSGGVAIGGASGSAADEDREVAAGPLNTTSGGQDPGGGGSFKWVTQTRLKRISLIIEYLTEHRVINGTVDLGKVCSM